jgi:hypothetical protein
MPEPVRLPDRNGLERECRLFCRYLLGREPDAYVLHHYYQAHVTRDLRDPAPGTSFDALLLRIGRTHTWWTRLADVYARFLLPHARLRTKLVFLLAILESCAPTESHFHLSRAGYTPVVLARLFGYGIASVLTLAAALIVFLPLHFVAGMAARRPAQPKARLDHA